LIAALLLCAGTAHAHPAVDTLASGPLLPDVEQTAIDQLVQEGVEPSELRPLFEPGLHRSVAVAGARVLQGRLEAGSTVEAPLAWTVMLESKHHRISHDPDVFERLLLGLQQADPSVLSTLAGHEPAHVTDMAWQQVHDNLLSPLAPGIDWQAPALEVSARAWTEDLLAQDQPLVRLQTDSGDAAFRLLEQLQVDALISIIRERSEDEGFAAVQAWKQRFYDWKEPWRAGQERGLLGATDPEPPGRPRAHMLRPRQDLSALALSGAHIIEPPMPGPSPWWLLALTPVAWLAGLRRFPRSRPVLFPLGAVGVGVGLLFVAEGVLVLAGVEPLILEHAELFSYRSEPITHHDRVFAQVGEEHVTLEVGGARYRTFSREPTRPRIVVLGESSAHGSNHLTEEAFAGLLEGALDAEVINAGVGGAVSDEIIEIGLQSLEFQPDVLVLYFGFNDLSRLAYMAQMQQVSPARARMQNVLDRSRLVAALATVVPEGLLAGDREDSLEPPAPGVTSGPSVEAMHDIAQAHATRNMRRLILLAEAADVDVVVAIQALNEDTCPPDATMASDPSVCVADRLRSLAVNAAAGTDAALIDVPAALLEHAGGPAGHAYFWDGIHPSRLGHAVIAKALEPTLRERIR
jgi:lysophospholipase L1-like esterase